MLVVRWCAAFGYVARASAEPATSIEYAEYRNDHWHYSLAVPADMTFAEYDAEGGGQRVQFTDATADKLFTIAAWPYSQYDLTLSREATPSTNADQPDHLEIVDVVRNDVFTVLFQKNGVHYVVVTLTEDEAWLTDILTTWRFTE
jgi:hypothetical protein